MIRCERATVERSGRLVVEAVTLAVGHGQAAAIVGRTASGKSSLLAAAATAWALHAGDILVAGRSVRREPEIVRRSLGYVPDRMPGWPGLRAGEFLEVFGSAAGLRRERLAAAVGRGLALAGLPAGDRTPLDALATGQQKRLLLARALLHEPDVLLLDDPFGGLDPLERLEMERFIGDALLMGRTVLAAIDDADVPACFTHLFVLAEGSLVASGPATPAAFSSGRAWRRARRGGHRRGAGWFQPAVAGTAHRVTAFSGAVARGCPCAVAGRSRVPPAFGARAIPRWSVCTSPTP